MAFRKMEKLFSFFVLLIFLVGCNPTSAIVPDTEVMTTLEPQASPTRDSIIYIDYNPVDWVIWHEFEGAPGPIVIDSEGQMWSIVHDKVSYFDGQDWVSVGPDDLGISMLHQLHIDHNGAIWVLGKKADTLLLVRYSGKNWVEISLPPGVDGNLVTIAVDGSDLIWIGVLECTSDNCLYRFDGVSWEAEQLPVRNHSEYLGGVKVLSEPDGNLWVCGGWQDGIAWYMGNKWQIYSGEELWPERPSVGFRSAERIGISAGATGSIWAFLESSEWIAHITKSGQVVKIPVGLGVDMDQIWGLLMHESQSNVLWVVIDSRINFEAEITTTLGYYDGVNWTVFTSLPFKFVYNIDETSDGVILLLTENGLYRYEPH